MIGISGALVVLQMASRAGAAGQVVTTVHVALHTRQAGVCSGKGESSTRVVEGCISPGSGAMAALTGLRHCCLHVIRIGRALVILQMARDACCVGQVVVSVDVALRTLQGDVRPGQRETCGGVIESSIGPGRGAVAAFASLRHSSLHVVGIGRALKVLQVAGDTCGIGQVVISVDVALRTLHRRVRPGQRKTCLGMIESGILP